MNGRRFGVLVFLTLLFSLSASIAYATTSSREEIQKYFPPPLVVGQEDDKLPIFPIRS